MNIFIQIRRRYGRFYPCCQSGYTVVTIHKYLVTLPHTRHENSPIFTWCECESNNVSYLSDLYWISLWINQIFYLNLAGECKFGNRMVMWSMLYVIDKSYLNRQFIFVQVFMCALMPPASCHRIPASTVGGRVKFCGNDVFVWKWKESTNSLRTWFVYI